jgi:hypothetical protein
MSLDIRRCMPSRPSSRLQACISPWQYCGKVAWALLPHDPPGRWLDSHRQLSPKSKSLRGLTFDGEAALLRRSRLTESDHGEGIGRLREPPPGNVTGFACETDTRVPHSFPDPVSVSFSTIAHSPVAVAISQCRRPGQNLEDQGRST